MRRNRASEITGQQYRTEDRGARNQIENRANGQDDSERNNHALGISKLDGWFYHELRLEQFHGAVEKEKKGGQRTEKPTAPKCFSRNTVGAGFWLRTGIGLHILNSCRGHLQLELPATAARTSALRCELLMASPSWRSIDRDVFASRPLLKRRCGSGSDAPLKKLIFT